ncbi:hypothetical protein Tco_1422223 [Tanacetum coccineum]
MHTASSWIRKKCRVDTEVFREILQICPRILNQYFIAPPSEEDLVTFIQELGYSGRCNMLSAIHIDQMHQPWRTFAAIINRINLHTIRDDSLLGTLKFVSKIQDYQQYGALIPDDMINQDIKDSQAYKTYYDFSTGNYNATGRKSYSRQSKERKKAQDRQRCFQPRALQMHRQLQRSLKALKKSKKDSHILHASGSGDEVGSQLKVPDELEDKTTGTNEGTGAKPGVLDVAKYLSESENESWGDSGDDESNDDDSDEVTKDDDEDDVKSDANEDEEASDSEKTDSDGDENLNVNQNDDEKEEHDDDSFEFNDDDEEYDALYKDVNVSASKEKLHEQVIKDAHVTLTSSQKTEGSKQSSFVPSDFVSKFLNLDNIPPVGDEVASLMNVKTPHEESRTQAPLILSVPVTAILETSIVQAITVPPLI